MWHPLFATSAGWRSEASQGLKTPWMKDSTGVWPRTVDLTVNVWQCDSPMMIYVRSQHHVLPCPSLPFPYREVRVDANQNHLQVNLGWEKRIDFRYQRWFSWITVIWIVNENKNNKRSRLSDRRRSGIGWRSRWGKDPTDWMEPLRSLRTVTQFTNTVCTEWNIIYSIISLWYSNSKETDMEILS